MSMFIYGGELNKRKAHWAAQQSEAVSAELFTAALSQGLAKKI